MGNFISCEVQTLFHDDAIPVLENIIGCMYCGIVMAKPGESGFVVWNQRAKEIIGKQQAEVPLDEWTDYYGCYDCQMNKVPSHELPLPRALAGEDVVNQELFICNESQPGAWISCNATPIKKNGEIIGGVVVFQDMTHQKRLEQQLKDLLAKIKCQSVDIDQLMR